VFQTVESTRVHQTRALADAVELSADARPHGVAVQFGDQALTYRQLDELSNQLAHRLRATGVGHGDVVGILAERGPRTVVAALGVLKADAAYAPMDPETPVLRLRQQLALAGARVVVAPSHLAARLGGPDIQVVALDDDWRVLSAESKDRPRRQSAPEDLYAVFFTSGSGGAPKAVAVEHGNMMNLLVTEPDLLPRPGEGALHVCTPQFDVGAYEIWAAVTAGARLVCQAPGRPEPRLICAEIAERTITWAAMATGIFHQLVEHDPRALAGMRLILVAGEPLSPLYARRLIAACPKTRLLNAYGPTETTVIVTAQEVTESSAAGQRIPIGRAIAGARLRILRDDGADAESGEAGELWIGGPCVARGYLRRPDLTAERFVAGRTGASANDRQYRTGDIVRERPDGSLEILGRVDDQLKVHGYRVEPGEVEIALGGHPGVGWAAVVAREHVPGHRQLVAYFMPASGPVAIPTLRRFLEERLPWYMVPSVFIAVDRVPLTVNGKLDRSALPLPPPPAASSEGVPTLASRIAQVFARVLALPAVDPSEDFLALGGDSLLGVQVIVRLQEALGLELSLGALFEARTAAALAERAALAGAAPDKLPPLRRRTAPRRVPATPAQAKALMIAELAEESLPYQSQAAHRIIGPLRIAALEGALSEILRRHEILRTTFHRVDGVWIQRVHEAMPVRLPIADLSREPDVQGALERHLAKVFHQRLDPAQLPLSQWSLARLTAQDHALIVIEHHVVHDGVSTARFLEELATFYAAEVEGRPSALPAPSVQYRDFSLWQADLIAGAHKQRKIAYWRDRLSGAPASLELPLDHCRPARQTYRGDSLRCALPFELAEAIRRRARQWGVTPYVLMLAAYALLLGRYGAVEDVVIGSGVANRLTLASEQLLGMLVNTVALRIELGGITLGELIERVWVAVLSAQAHQDVPFEQVVEQLAPARSGRTSPLYQTLFSFHDAPVRTLSMADVVLVPRDVLSNGSAKADLNVIVIHRRAGPDSPLGAEHERLAENGFTIVWEYNCDLFERATAERMLGEYCTLLEQFTVRDSDSGVRSLSCLNEHRRRQLLTFAGSRTEYERNASILEVFDARVAERPDATAVSAAGEAVSYRQLDRRANRLANRLRKRGACRGGRVGVCLERSLDLIVSFLAIAKAGAAYVPLDPADPPARLGRHLEALGIKLVLTHGRYRDQLPGSPVELICLDDWLDLAQEPDTPPDGTLRSMDPVYVMFTSGSTGSPHAVEVPHRAVVRLVRGVDYVRLGPGETLVSLAPPAFDASTFEIWGALLNGGRLVVAPPGQLAPADIGDLVVGERITTLWLTAGLFHRVMDDRPEILGSVRQLLVGGDVVSPDHARRALQSLPSDGALINGYGPTEGTTFTCAHRMHPGDRIDGAVPIGRPIPNSRVYILDPAGELLPIGAVGELWIGGEGVALGYVGAPELTAARFRPDPFAMEPGAIMYRSGDRARWRADGTLEFLGRIDRQVKLRGFRIEPAEIEEALRSHPQIAGACVSIFTRSTGDRGLAAYVVPVAGCEPSFSELRAHAARTLPSYAVPTAWSRMTQLPLTANGKIDLGALPPPQSGTWRTQAIADERPPDRIERRLIAIWEKALELDSIGVDEDFFDLGGHSLLAVEVFDAIERSFGRSLSLATIFEAPTVRRLAAALREDGWDQPQRSLVSLTRTGSRPPLFFVTAGDGNSVGFGALARRLGPDQPFFALQPRGINGGARVHVSVERMAAHYIREIRRISPKGPYFLGGRCLGGYVAYEMARRLEAAGERTALLVILDSGGPRWRERLLFDGTPFDEVMNSALRREPDAARGLGDIFSAQGSERLLAWLDGPASSDAGVELNRYLREVYQLRMDVRDAFPDVMGADAGRFIQWVWLHGRCEMGLAERLLRRPSHSLPHMPVAKGSSLRGRARQLAERFKWRMGEALDLVTRDRLPGAALRRRERLRQASIWAAEYKVRPYRGVVTLVRSEEYRQQTLLERWYGLDTGGIVEREVRGTHRSMMREPDVASLADCLRSLVDDALR
jgi:amino acid adenylation domain-containing protein